MESIARALIAAAELYGMSLSESQIEGYLSALAPWPPGEVVEGLASAIKECKFYPKPSEIIVRIPTKRAGTFLPEPKMPEQEQALGRDLFPLFLEYLNGKTSKEDWASQMQYFADKHGLGSVMRDSIRREGFAAPGGK